MNHPQLLARGNRRQRARLVRGLVLLALTASAGSAIAATKAGEVMLLTGRGTATDQAAANIRELSKGEPLFPGEVITTAVNSYLNIRFLDGSFVLLRPNSRFEIEAYEFQDAVAVAPAPPAVVTAPPKPVPPPKAGTKPPPVAPAPLPPPVASAPAAPASATSRAFFRLLKGGFRAVSGLIGKIDRNEYRVSTPVATIGIRGTDYVVVICDAACAKDPILRDDLPDQATAMEGGLIAGVVDGGIGVTSQTTTAMLKLSSGVAWLGGVGIVVPGGTTSELHAGDYVAVQTDGRQYPLGRMPGFLVRTPIPDPTTICQ
ncbi:MAG TPA: hypothetical protein VM074_06470 [Solimonas sp.]|nr:hypothetical protein [Solimonas sp.]